MNDSFFLGAVMSDNWCLDHVFLHHLEKDSSWAWHQCHSFLLEKRSRSGIVFSDRFSMNFCWWLIILRNFLSSATFCDLSIFSIAAVFSGSGPIPWALRPWPTNFNCCLENSHMSGFYLVKTASSPSCSFCVFPCTMVSSTMHITLSKPSSSFSILFWIAKLFPCPSWR